MHPDKVALMGQSLCGRSNKVHDKSYAGNLCAEAVVALLLDLSL